LSTSTKRTRADYEQYVVLMTNTPSGVVYEHLSLGDQERLQEHQTIHDCNDIKESRVAVFLLHVRVLAVSNLTPSVIDQEETVVDNTYTSELEPHLRLAVLRCHLGQHLLFRPWYGIYDDLRVSRVVAPEPTTRVRT